jgi:hypothetical protein
VTLLSRYCAWQANSWLFTRTFSIPLRTRRTPKLAETLACPRAGSGVEEVTVRTLFRARYPLDALAVPVKPPALKESGLMRTSRRGGSANALLRRMSVPKAIRMGSDLKSIFMFEWRFLVCKRPVSGRFSSSFLKLFN